MRAFVFYALVCCVGLLVPALGARAHRWVTGGATVEAGDAASITYERFRDCEEKSGRAVATITFGDGQPLTWGARSFPVPAAEWADVARAVPTAGRGSTAADAPPGRHLGCCRDRLTVTPRHGTPYAIECAAWGVGPVDGVKRALWALLRRRLAGDEAARKALEGDLNAARF